MQETQDGNRNNNRWVIQIVRINVKFAVGQATMHVANRRKDYVPLISKERERERVLSLYHYVEM